MDNEKFKMGWLLVAFDLPVLTREEKRRAVTFRNFLIDDGYLMIQWSVYARSCVTFARQKTHLDRLRAHIPEEGHVRAIYITRAQWERSMIMQGAPARSQVPEDLPEQILLW